ncbi:hypothetical protein [Nocardioides eburneiflavus]|nr:hypothetical protein [Nocardioides eburneiflavus]
MGTPSWLAAIQPVEKPTVTKDTGDAESVTGKVLELHPTQPVSRSAAKVNDLDTTDSEVVDGEEMPEGIETQHLDWFDSRGIPLEWAAYEVDARSIANRPAEWPEGLRGFAETGGGIRFTYASITGGPGWDQCKPDNPTKDENGRTRKYVGNSGDTTGERLIITKSMRARFEASEYKRVIITEGTGQTLVVSWLYRDQDEVLVIGVPGCWGWSAAGIAAPELHAACAKAQEVFVLFDKDVLTNPYVYDAGARISTVVDGATGTRPRFPSLPTSGTQGVDDWVAGTFRRGDGTIDDVEARRALNNLMKSKTASKPLSAKRPAGKGLLTTAGVVRTPDINRDECSISMRDPYVPDGTVTIAAFAPYIERMYVATSRLDKKARKISVSDIAVQTPIGLLRVEEWPTEHLNRIDDWLTQAGYPLGVWVNSDGNAAQIVAAMKNDAEKRGIGITTMSQETGWTTTAEGCALYVEAVGGITADGYTRSDSKALLDDPNAQRFDLSDLESADDEAQRKALRETVLAGDLFADPTWWIVTAGNIMWAGSGHIPEGMTFLLGKSNWGKSARQRAVAKMFGPEYKMETLLGKNIRNGSDIAQGLHNATAIPDDFAEDENNQASYNEQVAILDMLARRAGGSEDESNGRQTKREGTRGWVNGDPDPSQVAFSGSGETFPGAELRFSSRMRVLTVAIGPNGWTKADGTDRFGDWKTLGESGTLRLGHASYLRWVAGQIDRVGGFDAWVAGLGKRREAHKDLLWKRAPEIPKDLNRVPLVAAGRLVGWELLVEAALATDAITVDEAEGLKAKAFEVVLAAMVKHYNDHLTGDVGRLDKAALLSLIREAIATGDWDVTGLGTKGNYGSARTMGADHERDGQAYVCLIAAAVAEAVGIKRTKVLPALREASEGGKPQDLWWGGKSVSCYWVKREDLFPDKPTD